MADIDDLVTQLAALTAALNTAHTAPQAPHIDALAAAIAQLQQQQQAPTPTPSACVLPVFVLNAANPHFTKSWFAQAEMVLQLHTHNDADKVRMVVSSLDTSTFDKVRRALLPDIITELQDFAKLKKEMIKLFDAEDSLFARRFAALQVEWSGPEKESIREYEARIRECMGSFDMDNFGENEMASLIYVIGMKARALEPLRTMCVDALRKNPKIPLKELSEMVAASILTRQEQQEKSSTER
uniref:Retrotransposon gag domain-containing protein n=1 Tax=Panagrolaimus superbus TaxID=310955 RepID=A0A914Y5M7_9BILA